MTQEKKHTSTVCPTRYRNRHFFNNSTTNEDIATKFEQECVRCVRNEEESSLNEEPLHSEKTGVWCGMSRRRIIGPILFDATITTAAYMEIFNTFVNQLDDEELSTGYFQQDVPTSHTSHASMAEIQFFFGDRVISKGLWPPRSPDLTPSDCFLW